MRVTPALFACLLLSSAGVQAEVVTCVARRDWSQQIPANAQFEVWPEALPAPDYLDALDACAVRSGSAPAPKPPPSQWIENQRTAYTDALEKQRVDIVVAPFQIQGYGIERTERALMSADLAYHLDPAVRVADPFLTARALGEGARRYETNDILELARAVGARTAVVGYVGHDRSHRMTITVQVLKINADGGVETVQRDWRGVSFTHADPPFVVFHRMLPSVLESLSLPIAKQPHPRAPVAFPNEAAFSFVDLAGQKNALGSSLGLSLLGALSASSDELSRERLFERAFVSSWHFDAPGNETAFLRAYALLNLDHRPAALALINGATAPESVALRALLNGDLPGAGAATSTVKNPLKRLLLAVHVDDLRYMYQKEDVEQVTDAATVFGEDAADWLLLAEGRSNDRSIWHVDESVSLKFLLDDVYPISGLGVQSVLGGGMVVGASVDDVAVDVATMRHVARFVASADVPICCSAAGARVANWDLVSLLEGRTESRMRDHLYLTTIVRGTPNDATDLIERYRSVFEGNPHFAAARAEHANEMKELADGNTLQRWQREAREQALEAALWSPGQGSIAYGALLDIGVKNPEAEPYIDAYGFDYPRRPYWPYEVIRLKGHVGPDEGIQFYQGLREEAYPYARVETYAFIHMRPQSEAEKTRFLAMLEGRLIGHPGRPSMMARFLPPRPSSGDPVVDATAAVAEDPENWDIRFEQGRKLIEEHGKWKEAAELLLAYPYFHRDSPPNIVVVSNNAYDAGSIFYLGGHEDLAVPFYEVAANLQTGAQSQMTSHIRLNILQGNYRIATAGSYARAQRYPDAEPLRDLLSFMHALGYGEEAWNGFSQVASSFDDPQVWVSALVGHRMQGLTEPEIRAWLKQPGIRDARFRNIKFAPRYAVLVNAMDHMPPEDLGALVEELEGEPAGRMVSNTMQERPHPVNTSETIRVQRSNYIGTAPPPLLGTRVKSEFAFFGAAYASIRHGRFETAVKEFQEMAAFFQIEHEGYTYTIPYFAWAAAKTGDADSLEKLVNNFPARYAPFDFSLARALFHGVRKDTARARELLDAALGAMSYPYYRERPVLMEYQWAEACEWLYQETGDVALVDMLLAWVVSQQKAQPTHAWPYAMEYTYARDPARKRRALAMTLYLDPQSPRIRGANGKERADAEAWGAANNPFLQEQDPPEVSGPIARLSAQLGRAG